MGVATKILSIIVITLIASFSLAAQSLYIKTFGSANNKPLIFLHGGPGYNCANFEGSTAQELADKGFYVIVYDRRGEGRSKDPQAAFTFAQTFSDLLAIYEQYGLQKATLLGHSFGGVVATLFAEAHPDNVQSIILIGAPVSLQQTFRTILAKSKSIYLDKKDSANLRYITLLESMDTSSIEYSAYCFGHAMQNGFYTTKNQSDESKLVFARLKSDSALRKEATKMTMPGPQGFWKNEKYTSIDLHSRLQKLQTNGTKIFALYGKEDGLYSAQQVADLSSLIGESHLKYFDDCSHNVFIDQQTQFLDAIVMWTK